MRLEFKIWLEDDEKDFAFWQDLLPNFLGLDPKNGLSINLNSLDRQDLIYKLQSLGEFSQLPAEAQQRAIGLLQSNNPGTLGDLIRALADSRVEISPE